MHEEILNRNIKCLLDALGQSQIIKKFYLAGGTALSLYYGHRLSIYLDWFAEKFSNTPNFRKELLKLGKLSIDYEDEKTLNATLNGIKISFFDYKGYNEITNKVNGVYAIADDKDNVL